MAPPSSRKAAAVRRLVIFGALATSLGAVGCRRSTGDDEIASPEVPTVAAQTGVVTRRDLVETLLVRGGLVAPPNEDVKIASPVAGRVVAMRVAEGDPVRSGEMLAEIDPRPLAVQRRAAVAALAEARTALENAQRDVGRNERLLERGIASGKEVEDARARQAAAAAALEQAQAELSPAEIRSPIAGWVVKRFVGVGEQVDGTAAQPVIEVANVARLELLAQVPAGELARLREGQAAEVLSDADLGRSVPGRVIAIAPAIDPGTNAALVRIGLANPEQRLKVGMFASARVALSRRPGVLTVPAPAVARTEEGPAVYVVSGDVATRTLVSLGLETPDGIEVLSGVSQGQTVLVSSVHGLGEKARLATRP